MKTEELKYTVENIQMIFNYLTKCCEMHSVRSFRIEVDGLEIVPCTTNLNRFNDYLFYSSPESHSVTFTIYHRNRVEYRYVLRITKAKEDTDETEALRLKSENATLREEVQTLKRSLRRSKREKIIERPGDIKAIDAGDYLVVFIRKEAIDQALSEQVEQARAGLTSLEKVQHYFQRFMFHPKTK